MSNGTEGVYATLDQLVRLQYKARGFHFLPRQPVHSVLTGRHASRVRGRGLNFEEIRAYLPGDDIRSIDWKVTARTQEPHSRVFTEERDRPALLVVDQRLGMFFGSQVNMKSVTAAETAALGAWRVFGVGDRVGALIFDDQDIVELKAHRSRRQVLQILHAILEKNHALRVDAGGDISAEPAMLNRVLQQASRIAKHDYLVAIISDFDGADEETRRLVTSISQHNDALAILIYDPLAKELPARGPIVVSGGELQIELEMGNETVRQSLLDYSEGRMKQILSWQAELGIPVLPISTAEGPAEQVRRLLGVMPRGPR